MKNSKTSIKKNQPSSHSSSYNHPSSFVLRSKQTSTPSTPFGKTKTNPILLEQLLIKNTSGMVFFSPTLILLLF
jgi:hypothetical protein